jgi:hypothetical protein
MSTNTQVLFVSRPNAGKLDYSKVFQVSTKKVKPSPADLKTNEVLVRNVILGFDAASELEIGLRLIGGGGGWGRRWTGRAMEPDAGTWSRGLRICSASEP